MSKSFIFLEFLDPEINALIFGLRNEFGGRVQNTNVHITVRGPYYKRIDANIIKPLGKQLGDDPILIHSAGIFRNSEYVVYLKVESKGLKNIWWKPDYPVERFGFNPHITIYVGNNEVVAEAIYKFLKKENISLLTQSYKLIPYVSKQSDLFPHKDNPRSRHIRELSNRFLVRADILQRAANLVRACNAQDSNNSLKQTRAS